MITIPFSDGEYHLTYSRAQFIRKHGGLFEVNGLIFRVITHDKRWSNICVDCEMDCLCDKAMADLCKQFDFMFDASCIIRLCSK